jgi:methionyl aminopeptidase
MPLIILKSDAEIDQMKPAGRLSAKVLNWIEGYIKPGVTTLELDDLCETFIRDHGAIAAPLNYRGFPKSICTSVNNVVCHGIPSPKVRLKSGDIINVDITVIVDGYHGDTSRTFIVGEADEGAKRLVKVTAECTSLGIAAVRAGGRIGDIGAAIQAHAESHGYSVVREYVGHGIGRTFHEDPQIMHYGIKGQGLRLEPGMVFTIEPMINQGHWKTKTLADKWTSVTVDNLLSAQFEHTIAIRSNGVVEILTLE